MLPTKVADILAAIDNDTPCPECRGAKRWKRKIHCRRCSGDGTDVDSQCPCTDCATRGVVFNNDSAIECRRCNGYGQIWRSCKDCEGRGYSYETCSCSTCQGKGNLDFAKTVLNEGDDLYIAGIAAHMYHYSASDAEEDIIAAGQLAMLLNAIKNAIEDTFVSSAINEENFPTQLFNAGIATINSKIRRLREESATEQGRKKMSAISENISEMAYRYSETRRLTAELNEKYPPESY